MKEKSKDSRGQAMAEMLLSIPILFLFMAGIIQFSILFLAKTQFEHACGEAAREYSAGIINRTEVKREIWENLGSYQEKFDQNDIKISESRPSSPIDRLQSTFGTFLIPLTHALRNLGVDTPFSFGGYKWEVTANCEIAPYFQALFPKGVIFKSQFAVVRYPE